MNKKIIFSSHVLLRMGERSIPRSLVLNTIKNPDKIEVSPVSGRVLAKKIYFNQKIKKDHLLMVISEIDDLRIEIITIIDTSKISKYF